MARIAEDRIAGKDREVVTQGPWGFWRGVEVWMCQVHDVKRLQRTLTDLL